MRREDSSSKTHLTDQSTTLSSSPVLSPMIHTRAAAGNALGVGGRSWAPYHYTLRRLKAARHTITTAVATTGTSFFYSVPQENSLFPGTSQGPDGPTLIRLLFRDVTSGGPLPPHGPTGSDNLADATVCTTKGCNQPPPPPGGSRNSPATTSTTRAPRGEQPLKTARDPPGHH